MDFPIQDDNIALEPPEILTFTITVVDPVPGIEIDPYDTTIVTIVDDDRKSTTQLSFSFFLPTYTYSY